MRQREGGYGWKKVFKKVCDVESECWILNEDDIWIWSQEALAVDTFL